MSIPLNELLHRHRLASPISWAVLAVLVALAIWAASKLVWLGLQWSEPLPEPLPLMVAPTRGVAPPSSLSRWHLFGNAAPMQDGRSLAADAPETQLQLSLLGVWAGRDPKQGRAIIADAAGAEANYHTGAEVAPGVLLDQVLRDRVVLSRAGVAEVLMLARDTATSANVARTSTATATATGKNSGFTGAVPIGAPISMGALGAPVGVPQLPMQGVDLEAVRRQLGADPNDLAQNITALPVMENGKFVGVRLSSAKYAGALAKLGLQADDVVTQVNGVDVSDPARIASVVSGLSNGGRLSVAVRRNGKLENLNVDLN